MNSRQRTYAVGFVAVALLFSCLNSSGCFSSPAVVGDSELSTRAELYADGAERVHRVLTAVLKEADPKTSLVADHFHGEEGSSKNPNSKNSISKNPISKKLKRLNYNRYSPHNSAADLYPFLVLGAHFTEPGLLRGRLLEMLRNEVKYTSSKLSIPGNFDLKTGRLYRSSLFGAAEYAKDGLSPITELLGRTAWFYRMYELMVDVMEVAPFKSDFGMLPGRDTELNGDMLQVLFRLALMTGEERFADWARRIADAYIFEVLPQSNGLPVQEWSFKQHRGHKKVQLRDHGNETVVGLALVYAYEKLKRTERASRYEPVLRQMFERLLESTNPDGFFYNSISCDTLQPVDSNLADSWGYVYSAIYNFYLLTNETRYRDAVLRVLRNLPKYRDYLWEGEHYDGIADSVEGAIYLLNREPVPEAFAWVDAEMQRMYAQQRSDGHLDGTYLEGNFIRTTLLYISMKSQGVSLVNWVKGAGVGAIPKDGGIDLTIIAPKSWDGAVRFDGRRFRRHLNLPVNLIRLNESPEWFTVEENALYKLERLEDSSSEPRSLEFLGSELISGVMLSPGSWRVRRVQH